MAQPHERARQHEDKMLKLPNGEQEEINFPVETPGETVYLTPRAKMPPTEDNTGSRPTGKSGKNY